jgi:hypothetical protein
MKPLDLPTVARCSSARPGTVLDVEVTGDSCFAFLSVRQGLCKHKPLTLHLHNLLELINDVIQIEGDFILGNPSESPYYPF